jgi:hypothetical protein
MALLSAACAVAARRTPVRPAIDGGLGLLLLLAAAGLFGWSRTRPERPRRTDDTQQTERRVTALAFFYLLGTVIFVLGLMAPLSMAAGIPPTWKVLVFSGIPGTLLVASALLFPGWAIRGPLLIPVVAMLGFTVLRLCTAA